LKLKEFDSVRNKLDLAWNLVNSDLIICWQWGGILVDVLLSKG